MEEDHAQHCPPDSEDVVKPERRDQRHLQRHDQHGDHGDEEPVAAGEVEPGEGVPGKRTDEDDQQRVADGDVRRRLQRPGDAAVVEEGAVIRFISGFSLPGSIDAKDQVSP